MSFTKTYLSFRLQLVYHQVLTPLWTFGLNDDDPVHKDDAAESIWNRRMFGIFLVSFSHYCMICLVRSLHEDGKKK